MAEEYSGELAPKPIVALQDSKAAADKEAVLSIARLTVILTAYLVIDFLVLFWIKTYWDSASNDRLFLVSALEFAIVSGLAVFLCPGLLSRSRWVVDKVDIAVAFSAAALSRVAGHFLFPYLHPSVHTPVGILAAVLLAPVTEEILVRGIVLRSLIERFPRAKWLMAIGVSMVVAFLHPAFWNALILELVLTAVYLQRRNSLGASIVCHVAMNALIFTRLG